MLNKTIDTIFEQFNNLNVLVVGDVMVDSYMWGEISRMSPEAPVPIVAVSKKENRLGGAANVVLNIQALGATPILCSVIGKDNAGSEVITLLKNKKLSVKGILEDNSRPTTVKTRIIAGNKHALRVDEEIETDISTETENKLFDKITAIIQTQKIDVLVFEDYNKGTLPQTLIVKVIELAEQNAIPTIVDPKKRNFLSYKNSTLFKPNLKELKEGLGVEINPKNKQSLVEGLNLLKKEINYKNALITLSEHGVVCANESTISLHPAFKRNILDVSGAGDTVLSVAALCLAIKTPIDFLAKLSNLAGGLVCESVGVVSINKATLLGESKKLINN